MSMKIMVCDVKLRTRKTHDQKDKKTCTTRNRIATKTTKTTRTTNTKITSRTTNQIKYNRKNASTTT